jgi:hypothetical protein
MCVYHIYVKICLSYMGLWIIAICVFYLSCLNTTHSVLPFNSTPKPNTTRSHSVLLYSATKQKIERLCSYFQTQSRAIPFSESRMESFCSIRLPNQTFNYLLCCYIRRKSFSFNYVLFILIVVIIYLKNTFNYLFYSKHFYKIIYFIIFVS